jgi:GNAT superfamily N-acetyltransferase
MKRFQLLGEKYHIIPLSEKILNEANALIAAIFHYRPDREGAKKSFADSLKHQISNKQYWLAVNPKGEVAGITGLYHDGGEKSIAWLGWFGVHPQHRRHGLGAMLLEFAVSEAKKRGFSILKLYSSFDENERASHYLFRKFGFQQFKSNKKKDITFFKKELT